MAIKFKEIETILKNPSQYYAHKKEAEGDKKVLETLEEHTQLCQQYFERIYENKCIDEVMERFVKKYLGECSREAEELVKEMCCNVVTFHDMGKHNPNFQRDILGRKEVERNRIYSLAGSGHSALSAALYMNYYYKRLRELGGEEGMILCTIMVCNAYAIARHHSYLIAAEQFLNSFLDGKNYKILEILKQESGNLGAEEFVLNEVIISKLLNLISKMNQNHTKEQRIWLYFYEKLTYSMLVASDYYATSEFMSGVKIENMGELDNISDFFSIHQNTKVNKGIRRYEKSTYPMGEEELQQEREINILRNEIFLEAERQLLKEKEKNIFYLEAPTGSGKSNISMNLSFQLAMQDKKLKKIYYIYPFNTLIEQNQETLREVFEGAPDIMQKIAVVNSVTPIKCVREEREKAEREEKETYYEKALLNRQFLNYPVVLTTHVSLFDTIFGESKESAFGFHQLAGSIVVLDEIQSYRNSIWGEIIEFLTELAEFMHMKIIIMSATLPNLEMLKEKSRCTAYLIPNRAKYFCHTCFQQRVQINGELLGKKISIDALYEHVKCNCGKGKKILVEFITKAHAEEFYNKLKQDREIKETVLCMSGDDSVLERKRVIQQVKEKGKPVILTATQVVEAGIDIDMDIGYKNIAKMDSEEQFLGRINRSYTAGRKGIVYFFEMDSPQKIYRGDIRSEWELLVKQPDIWKLLEEKDFKTYYDMVLQIWKKNNAHIVNQKFFTEEVGKLNFPKVKEHMELIEEQRWNMSVYLGRQIVDEKGDIIDGNKLWKEYKELLQDMQMNYAEKKVKLSKLMARMNYFIYQIKQNSQIIYNEQIGELFYIEDGENYFENGRLNRKRIEGQLGEVYVEFI